MASTIPSERFCRSCLHSLRGIASAKCPECGADFDPKDHRTTLAHPHRQIGGHLGLIARILMRASLVVAALAFIAALLGFDRPRIMGFVPCAVTFGFVILAIGLAIPPPVILTPRQRVALVIFPLLFVSIDVTRWPLYLCGWLGKPWLNVIADQVQAGGPTFQRGGRPVFRRGVVLDNGTVGFQLMGGDGGGIYLVRSAGPIFPDRPERVWYNTNWENSIGGNWYVVYQD